MMTIESQIIERLKLFPRISPFLGTLNAVRGVNPVADSDMIFAIADLFIVLVSPAAFPSVVAEEVDKIKLAKEHLSASEKIIEVIVSGQLDNGQTFAVLPKGSPLSNNRLVRLLQKRRLVPIAMQWIRSLAADATAENASAELDFEECLTALATVEGLSDTVKQEASTALEALKAKTVCVRHCPMHGDLWIGNFVQLGGDFKVIDWRGFQLKGYGFFDLTRFSKSCGIGAARFSAELNFHKRLLQADDLSALTTLLAACGHIYRSLDQFPLPRFIEMTESLLAYFRLNARCETVHEKIELK